MRRHLCLLVLLLRWVCMCLTTTCRYQELAELAMRWLQSHADVAGSQAQDLKRQAPKEAAKSPPLLDQMAHEVYRVVLFAVFYLQVSLLGYVPHVGVDLPLCARACSYSALCAAGHLVPEILDQVVSWVWDTIFTTDAIHPDSSLVDVQYLLDRATSVDAWASARGFGRSFYQMCASVQARCCTTSWCPGCMRCTALTTAGASATSTCSSVWHSSSSTGPFSWVGCLPACCPEQAQEVASTS